VYRLALALDAHRQADKRAHQAIEGNRATLPTIAVSSQPAAYWTPSPGLVQVAVKRQLECATLLEPAAGRTEPSGRCKNVLAASGARYRHGFGSRDGLRGSKDRSR